MLNALSLLGAAGLDIGALLVVAGLFCAVRSVCLRLPVTLAGSLLHDGWELAPGDCLESLYLKLMRAAVAVLVLSAALLFALRALWNV